MMQKKICLLGSYAVGKTSLAERFVRPLTIAAPGFQNTVIRHRDAGEATVALQPRVTGVVVDGSTGRTIPGAFVTSGDIELTTDANGVFELEQRPPGPLRVLAPGYRRIDVDASQERQIVARVEPIAIKALPWTNHELARATHTPDLGPGLTTVLSLDHRVAGLGSSACGPVPLERYLVPPERFRFTVHLRAVSGTAQIA